MDFTTVAKVKSYLSVQPGTVTDNGLLQDLVSGVSAAFRTRLNRDILTATYDQIFNGNGGSRLILPCYPVTNVALVEIGLPSSRVPATFNTDYVWDKLSVQMLSGRFQLGVANVHVIYTAGYATIPNDLESACTKTVCFRYKQLQRLGQSSKTMGQETVYFDNSELPKDVAALLDNYKNVVPST